MARRHGFFPSDAGRGGVVVAEDDFGDAASLFALSAGVVFTGVQQTGRVRHPAGAWGDRSNRKREMEWVVENFSIPILMSAKYFDVRLL